MTKLEQKLIEMQEAKDEAQANRKVKLMLNRVVDEDEDPKDVLFEFGLGPDYTDDILNWVKYTESSEPAPIPSEKEQTMMVKIKALLDKANSTDSQAEKDAFMMKAQELIQKHSLDITKVMAVKGGRNSTGFLEEDIIEERVRYEENWDRELMKNVAVGNMCKVIYNSGQSQIYIIGCESNAKSVCLLIDFYKKGIMNLAVADAKRKRIRDIMTLGQRSKLDREIKRMDKEEKENIADYLGGAVEGLKDALENKVRLFKDESFGENSSTGLMITGRSIIQASEDRIDSYISKTYPNLGYFRGGGAGGNSGSYAYGKGFADGGGLGASQKRLG